MNKSFFIFDFSGYVYNVQINYKVCCGKYKEILYIIFEFLRKSSTALWLTVLSEK